MATEAIYFHHNDHLGTPQTLTDANGTVVWSATYTPFGITTIDNDPDGDGLTVENNFRMPGQYYDAESGLFYNYFRSYDPIIGAYPQSDPIGLDGGLNTFAYVGGNPVSYIDPQGLDSFLAGRGVDTGFAGHLYIVVAPSGCLGDPDATVYSYGNTDSGKVGRVTAATTNRLSRTTHRSDRAAWLSLKGKQSSFAVQKIPASDEMVRSYVMRLKENHNYSVSGPNSNSAARAIVNKATGVPRVMSPMGWYPGEDDWHIMEFR